MGHRTLSLRLVLQALFLNGDAYDQMRDDDNPFAEGLFLIVIIGAGTALLALIGQLLAWAGAPQLSAIKQVIWDAYQKMPWWSQAMSVPGFFDQFKRYWDLGWQIFPAMAGAPSPAGAVLNIVIWPLAALLRWLVYGLLAFVFARLLKGTGTLNQTLGTLALAFSPMLLRGLEFIPYLVIGGVISTWQLICRYKAVRSVHGLSWGRAFWATVLPFVAYVLFWLLLGGVSAAVIAAVARR